MADEIVRLGCLPEKVIVHRLGVDLTRIPFEPRVWDASEALRILVASTFVEKKGIPFAIAAVAKAHADGLTDVRLTIIGDAPPGTRSPDEKRRILQTAKDSGLGERIEFLGFCEHERVHEVAGSHHLFLAPSVTAADGDTEGGAPVVLIEMAASGMPIVSTAHCDIPQVVEHGQTAWLAPERDIDSLARGLRWWAENHLNWRERLTLARDRIELRFDAAAAGRRLAEIYAQAIAKTRPS